MKKERGQHPFSFSSNKKPGARHTGGTVKAKCLTRRCGIREIKIDTFTIGRQAGVKHDQWTLTTQKDKNRDETS